MVSGGFQHDAGDRKHESDEAERPEPRKSIAHARHAVQCDRWITGMGSDTTLSEAGLADLPPPF
jgi:hypothetical protein